MTTHHTQQQGAVRLIICTNHHEYGDTPPHWRVCGAQVRDIFANTQGNYTDFITCVKISAEIRPKQLLHEKKETA